MNTPTPRPCWICGDPANTDEHRRKRSDLVARYGASWTPEQQPFVLRGDASTRSTRIQGPNDRKNLYQRMLCDACNSTRTKPFDHAYQQFSDWVLASASTLHERNAIDFVEIFGDTHDAKSLDLLRYFAEALGCRIVHAGLERERVHRTYGSEAVVQYFATPLIVDNVLDPTLEEADGSE